MLSALLIDPWARTCNEVTLDDWPEPEHWQGTQVQIDEQTVMLSSDIHRNSLFLLRELGRTFFGRSIIIGPARPEVVWVRALMVVSGSSCAIPRTR